MALMCAVPWALLSLLMVHFFLLLNIQLLLFAPEVAKLSLKG